jgi:nucleoside-diphosphate-sugar epimerase
MNLTMPVLITGSGLVGSQIARILVERGESPVVFDLAPQLDALGEIADLSKIQVIQGDIKDAWDLARALRDFKPDEIVHTAAYPMLTAGAQKRPYDAIELNIMGTTNVLEAARSFGVKRMVVVSSSVLTYSMEGGEDEGDASKEEAFARPTTFYAATKQAVEAIALNYTRWLQLDVRIVRYAAVAGPWKGKGGGEPSNIFRRLVENAIAGREVEIPNIPLEWIYSKDAAAGTVLALKATIAKDRVFNLSMGPPTTPEALTDALRSVFADVRVRTQAGDLPPRSKWADKGMDLGRAKKILGFQPAYDMAGAIRDYSAWMRTHASH